MEMYIDSNSMPSDTDIESDYYDGHHKQHNVGFIALCDSLGHVPGKSNDIGIWCNCEYK